MRTDTATPNSGVLKAELAFQRRLAMWSDGEGQRAAIDLAEHHRHLLPGRITKAQLSGLMNVTLAAPDIASVHAFMIHQGQRAEKAGQQEVKDYWQDVSQALTKTEIAAAELAADVGLAPVSEAQRKGRARSPAWLELALARAFMQHLVAHSLYLAATVRAEKR